MLLKRESSIPIYQQIADGISEEIRRENMKKGDRLSTEYELVERYNVSRATVRRAISLLVEKEIINVSPGKGMFVNNPVIEMNFNELRGIYEILDRQGLKAHTKVLEYEKVIPPASVTKILGLELEEEIYSIQRIYYIDNEPLAYSNVYFSSEIEFTHTQVEEMKIYDILQNELSIILEKAEYTIKVSQAKPYLNEILQNEDNAPYLKMERTTYCVNKKPREVTVAHFCSDKYQFNFSIRNDGEINI